MKRCLICLVEAQLNEVIDMLEVVKQMYGEEQPIEIIALAINRAYDGLMGAFDTVITLNDKKITDYDQKSISKVVQEIESKWHFDAILIPATPFGRMLAPRISMALQVGLVADVTGIKRDINKLKMIRPAYSGRLFAQITTTGKRPYMMTIRQGVFSYKGDKDKNTKVIEYKPKSIVAKGIRVITKKSKPPIYDIRESEVLISGGGGINKDFAKLERLANALGGQVAASRSIVDKGLAPRNIQVGQSGKRVSPTLYIALGIHGAIQHVEGLGNIDNIIAVNTNKNAPICHLADLIVEGDASQFITRLIEKIKSQQS